VSVRFCFVSLPPPATSTLFPYTDALPISVLRSRRGLRGDDARKDRRVDGRDARANSADTRARVREAPREPGWPGAVRILGGVARSEEHTSELQSHLNLVCRLLLEKKKQTP